MKTLLKAAAVAMAFTGISAGAQADAASEKLDTILAAQPDKTKARYQYRHPKETLEFFGVKPGMTVADTLPGAYYSRILLPYLGDDGALIGVTYSMAHRTIDFKDREDGKERLERHAGWPERFVESAQEWRGGSQAAISAYHFGNIPASLDGTVDVFLMFRATHHLYKHEEQGGTLGIVQHRAPEGNSDDWARGFNGYLKQSAVIKALTGAGFEFVGSSEINANPKDKPTEQDYVWRLPPAGDAENIGESDRMTLRFRKPG